MVLLDLDSENIIVSRRLTMKALIFSDLHKFSGHVIYTLIAGLLCFLPFVVQEGLTDATQSTKFLAFSYVIILLLLSMAIRFLFARNLSFNLNIIDVLVSLLFGYISLNRYVFTEDYIFSLKYLELPGLLIFYFFLRQFNLLQAYTGWLVAIALGGLLQCIYGLLQLYGYHPSYHYLFKITGGFSNPGPYSGYIATCFPAALGLYLFKDRIRLLFLDTLKYEGVRQQRILTIVTEYIPASFLCLSLLVLPTSKSRAAWLSVALSTLILLIDRYRIREIFSRYLKTKFKQLLSAAVISVILTSTLLGLYLLNKESGNGRLLIWKVTANIIADQPWLGVGYDHFKMHYMSMQATYFEQHPDADSSNSVTIIDYAFNETLQFVAESGIWGALLALSLIAISLKGIRETRDPLLSIGISGILSIFVFSCFSYPAEILPICLNMVFYVALVIRFYKSDFAKQLDISVKGIVFPFLIMIVVILVLSFATFSHRNLKKLYQSYADWNTATLIYRQGLYDKSLPYYLNAYPIFQRDGQFLGEYGKALTMNNRHFEALEIMRKAEQYQNAQLVQIHLGEIYQKLGRYTLAEKAFLKGYYMNPSRLYPQYLLAKLYRETGKLAEAREIARKVIKEEPKINSKAVEEMKSEMKMILEQDN